MDVYMFAKALKVHEHFAITLQFAGSWVLSPPRGPRGRWRILCFALDEYTAKLGM